MSGQPGAPAPTLTSGEIAVGAALLPTGHISIPHAAYRQLLDQATSAGRAALEAEVAPKITQLGFSDLADMLVAVDEIRSAPPEPPAPNPMDGYAKRAAALEYASLDELFDTLEHHSREYDATQGAQMSQPPVPGAPAPVVTPAPVVAPASQPNPPGLAPGDDLIHSRKLDEGTRARISKLREELRGKVTVAEQARAAAETELQQSRKQVEVMRAEEGMKLELVRAGIGAGNFEYAWYQLKQRIAELAKDPTPEGLKKLSEFSATTWATEQRATTPYLFGEHVVPASTGATGGAPQPAPMGASAMGSATAAAGLFDARTASPADMRKRMGDLGIVYKGNAPPIQR